MKIIRHTARDMRQALRAVREQLGEDAVILSSRRTSEGVEVTAAVDFDASTLEAGGFTDTPPALAQPPGRAPSTKASVPKIIDATPIPAASRAAPSTARPPGSLSPTALALTTGRAARTNKSEPVAAQQQFSAEPPEDIAPQHIAAPAPSYDELAAQEHPNTWPRRNTQTPLTTRSPIATPNAARNRAAAYSPAYHPGYDADWISEAAREAVAEHVASERAPGVAAGRGTYRPRLPQHSARRVSHAPTGPCRRRHIRRPLLC